MNKGFLPISKKDLEARGWKELDVIIVTGDAYVDHHSYGASLIGRLLEANGFRVGIIAQPDWRSTADFLKLGRPKLFFGITAGNIDSMVANYTASKKPRRSDDYSPGGKGGCRPDRAAIVYANRVREAFGDIPIIVGGIEASLRRLAHYDYWAGAVRRSIILDSRADMVVYGMGERQALEIASRLKSGERIKDIDDIRGTVLVRSSLDGIGNHIVIPSFEEVSQGKDEFNEAFLSIYSEADPFRGRPIVQAHANRYVIQLPPAMPMDIKELDKVYGLDYINDWHPAYAKYGGIPGFETVRFSIISHRGCCGGCNFCSLYLHQGRIVQSRSRGSIVKEVRALAKRDDFRGTITDVGGPTANLYFAECALWKGPGTCADKRCLMPQKCKNLKLGYAETLKLWNEIKKVPGVKHLFIGSGVRYDLLVDKYSDEYLAELCASHISGRLKVAPEHCEDAVLDLMNKPSFSVYEKFVRRFEEFNRRLNKKQYLVNYIISAHPGAGLKEAKALADRLSRMHINPEQIQDFIPLPMTVSACIYYTGKDPFTKTPVYVPRTYKERAQQRALIQPRRPRR